MTVDYMHIGASRSGSTWWYEILKHHPSFFIPNNQKNLYFWNKELAEKLGKKLPARTLEEYRNLFANSGNRLGTDLTDGLTYISENKIRELKEHSPDVKITFFIRNPITTLWSHVVKLQICDHRKSDTQILDRMFDRGFSDVTYLENVLHRRNVERWKSIFGDQVQVFLSENVQSRETKLCDIISEFLNVDRRGFLQKYFNNRVNQGQSKVAVTSRPRILNELVEYFDEQISWTEDYFNQDLSHWRKGLDG